jgi:alpha-tubulin suppressor-like RCC1 family protein
MSGLPSRVALALIACCASACGTDALARTVVVVEAEPEVLARTTHTTLVVTRTADGTAVHSDVGAPRPAKFPYTIALSPRANDTSLLFGLQITALDNGQPVTSARIVTGYVDGQTRYVRLLLEDACIEGPSCAAGETCHQGSCVNAMVEPNSLATDRNDAVVSTMVKPALDGFGADAGVTAAPHAADQTLPQGTTTESTSPDASTLPAPNQRGGDDADAAMPNQQGADTADAATPNNGVPSPTLRPVSRLGSGGYTHTERACAIKPDGTVICWGRGFSVSGASPEFLFAQGSLSEPIVATGLSNVLQTVHGDEFSCALLAPSRTVVCWGENDGGYLGNGTEVRSETPTPVPALSDIVQLSAQRWSTCALRSDGIVVCWGLKLLPDGSYFQSYNVTPTVVEGLRDIKRIASNSHYTCAIDSKRDLYCWGKLMSKVALTPTKIEGLSYVNEVAIGRNRACAAAYIGNYVSCWGADGVLEEVPRNEILNVVQLSMEDSSTCALMLGGRVTCWGFHPDPDLSDTGQSEDRIWQVQIEEVLELSSTTGRTCARKIDGSVACWGMHLGAGENVQSHIPVRAVGL